MERKEQTNAWSKIIARAWADEEFKKRLIQNPQEVFKEYGIAQKGVQYKIHENTEKEIHLMLPPVPAEGLSEETLREIAAAGYGGCATQSNCGHHY